MTADKIAADYYYLLQKLPISQSINHLTDYSRWVCQEMNDVCEPDRR